MSATSSRFQRWLLPGLAYKALVIGGGYATGRELAEFIVPSGPRGGLLAIALAATIWSVVAAVTFLFARATGSTDYRSFFRHLLGPAWIIFEIIFVLTVILVLAIFGAAAGAIGHAVFGWPQLVGTLLLALGIASFTTLGNVAVEELFKWVSVAIYGVYVIFLVTSLSVNSEGIAAGFAMDVPADGWIEGGLAYSGYNVMSAIAILATLRHLRGDRDAVVAGLLCGPLAMLPALLFFICMVGYWPQIAAEPLPSDYMLRQLNMPILHVTFQVMILLALLESGTGVVHAGNERLAAAFYERTHRVFSPQARLTAAVIMLVVAVIFADRFGLVALIAKGYRTLSWVVLVIYVLPVMTYGFWYVMRARRRASGH